MLFPERAERRIMSMASFAAASSLTSAAEEEDESMRGMTRSDSCGAEDILSFVEGAEEPGNLRPLFLGEEDGKN